MRASHISQASVASIMHIAIVFVETVRWLSVRHACFCVGDRTIKMITMFQEDSDVQVSSGQLAELWGEMTCSLSDTAEQVPDASGGW